RQNQILAKLAVIQGSVKPSDHSEKEKAASKKEKKAAREKAKEIAELKTANHRLTAKVSRLRAARDKLKQKLAVKPTYPGWHVIGVNGKAAVVAGPGKANKLIHTGGSFFGDTVEKVDPTHNRVYTTAGVIPAMR